MIVSYCSTQIHSSRKANHKPLNQEAFRLSIQQEFCQGSGIVPGLYEATVSVCADLEIDSIGEPTTPIHDALNWRYSRFGKRVKDSFYAALLLQETGDCWQAKLSRPRVDSKTLKPLKYETPIGGGSNAYLPTVPAGIRQRIAERYEIQVPESGSFWQWLTTQPHIPRIWTEGGKKALSLLSQGYVAIALTGVNGGYRKTEDGSRLLRPDVVPFAHPCSRHILAFDQDETPRTRRRVNLALLRFGGLLQQSGAAVSVATWASADGKGIDDLLVNRGSAAVARAIAKAQPLPEWHLWQRLDHRLTTAACLRVNTTDLSSLDREQIPAEGIIGLAAAKGTGKTKLLSTLVSPEVGAIAPSHRVALCRNLCHRLGLDYRGDIAGAKQAGVVQDGVYRIGVGLCVDSLLAIDPSKFAGRDLIIDEVEQVVRHLLTSSTCAKDGKRPALLARWQALVKAARRVIASDADLTNATLHYLQELRGDRQPVFLIRNDYRPPGYAVQFLNAPDRTAITAQLLQDLDHRPAHQALLVMTDSKRSSQAIAQLIHHHCPNLRILVINSETSSGSEEREFITTPDAVLERGGYDVILASPSMGTGISIEAQDRIFKVYGVFTGVSLTDSDMLQALGRVRQPVERVVWCNRLGRNFSRVSHSSNPLELKDHLRQKTSATISLIRSSLRADTAAGLNVYDWQNDPHLNLFVRVEAERNYAMKNLRLALLTRLRYEGHQVSVQECDRHPAIHTLLKQAKADLNQIHAEGIANARDLSLEERLVLEARESLTPEDQRAIAKYWIKEFYALDTVTIEDALFDQDGRRRLELQGLEHLLDRAIALKATVRSLHQQAEWDKGYTPWDSSSAMLRQQLRQQLRLTDFLDAEKCWTKQDLEPYAQHIRQRAAAVKSVLNFTVSPALSDVQVVHQLLSQLGIKIGFTWSRKLPGLEGKKCRVYRLDALHWRHMKEILDRRKERLDSQLDSLAGASAESEAHSSSFATLSDPPPDAGSPPIQLYSSDGGDPALEMENTGLRGWDQLLREAMSYGQDTLEALIARWTPRQISQVLMQLTDAEFNQFATLQPLQFKDCA